MFVDTGVPLMMTQLFRKGMRKSSAVIKVAGASNVLDNQDLFRIGKHNYTVLRKILWKSGLLIEAEDVGGHISRAIRLEIDTGLFAAKSGGLETEL